jgi:hypothetical protein
VAARTVASDAQNVMELTHGVSFAPTTQRGQVRTVDAQSTHRPKEDTLHRIIRKSAVALVLVGLVFATAFVGKASADTTLYGGSGTPGTVGDLVASCSPGNITALAPSIGAVPTPNWVDNGDGTYTWNYGWVGPNEQTVVFRAQLYRLDASGWTYVTQGHWMQADHVPEVETAAMGAPRWWTDLATGDPYTWGSTHFNIAEGRRYGVRYEIWWYPSQYTNFYSHWFAFDSNPCAN